MLFKLNCFLNDKTKFLFSDCPSKIWTTWLALTIFTVWDTTRMAEKCVLESNKMTLVYASKQVFHLSSIALLQSVWAGL